MKAFVAFTAAGAILAPAACNRRAMELFLDIPPASRAPPPKAADSLPVSRPTVIPVLRDTQPAPPFEKHLNADSARAQLPRDRAGNIDWVAAVRSGVIRPRSTLPGRAQPDTNSFRFLYDFYFPGPDTLFDAYFPHSTHTEWLNCQQCHARIFPYRGVPMKMADILQGKYCAECHGKVSFPVVTDCERCHTRLTTMPPGRASNDLIGTITLTRARPDSGRVVEGNASGVATDDFPRAVFPHWVHRSRYRCKACHMEVFEPKAGANRITMKDISEGRRCGVCHNGQTAFAVEFGQCERCHISPVAAAPPSK